MAFVAAALIFRSGPHAGRRVDLETDVMLGRVDADIAIEDAEVSRRHALIRVNGPAFVLEDLGSQNGTLLDGRPVMGPAVLHDGARIRVGQTELAFEVASSVNTGLEAQATRLSATPATRLTATPIETRSAQPRQPAPTVNAPPSFQASRPRGRHAVASRQTGMVVFTFGTIIATSAALVVYFWQHTA
jgi:predicted component of type VI protein secretion system